MSGCPSSFARVLIWLVASWLCSIAPIAARAALIEPTAASVLVDAQQQQQKPPPADAAWRPVALPDDAGQSRPAHSREPVWYRIDVERRASDAADAAPWGIYLPYLYYGGSVWLNDHLLANLPVSDERSYARSYRPRLIALPAALLRDGRNEIAIRAEISSSLPMQFGQPAIGPFTELQPRLDRRLFWALTVPQLTVFGSVLVASFMLLIWWRRPNEVLYGLFSIAAALWGIRSITFLIDEMTWTQWHWWRVLFQCATGGFVIAMALFALRLARLQRPWIERALIGYGLVGPLWFAFAGFSADTVVGRWWLGGMMAVGISIIVVTLPALARQKKLLTTTLRVLMVCTVLLGIHDYLLTWHPAWLAYLLPEWTGQRIFLLHVGTSAMLLAMGGLLTERFIKSLAALEDLNRTLEMRVADRERALAANYEQLAALQREHAAAEERQMIMRDLHDGLGSQLFTSLSRVERGDMDEQQIASALRACIADMRIALDTLAARDHDLGAAFGDFMFRWQAQLASAGVESRWNVDLPNHATALAPHAALQVLRVAQEALTNVLKHAHANHVSVQLRETGAALELRIEDDGRGLPPIAQPPQGRGLGNMRTRAERLGGTIDWQPAAGGDGTRVVLVLPLAGASGAFKPEAAPPVAAAIA